MTVIHPTPELLDKLSSKFPLFPLIPTSSVSHNRESLTPAKPQKNGNQTFQESESTVYHVMQVSLPGQFKVQNVMFFATTHHQA